MYWPIGTPRVYATSSSQASAETLVSQDGLPSQFDTNAQSSANALASPLLAVPPSSSGYDDTDLPTPITPATPAIQSVEHDTEAEGSESGERLLQSTTVKVPVRDPVLALRVSRTGHLFAVITSTSMTIWQTKVHTEAPISSI
jgi:RAB6A-GEF complex partner protein 1